MRRLRPFHPRLPRPTGWLGGLFGTLLAAPLAGQVPARPDYPSVRRTDFTMRLHDTTIADPYQWLEDRSAPGYREFVDQQAALLQAFLRSAPRRQEVETRIRELTTYERYATPGTSGGWLESAANRYFFIRTPVLRSKADGWERSLEMRTGVTGPQRSIFGFNAAEGAVVRFVPAPDGERVMLYLARPGERWLTGRVLDVASGKLLPDRLERVHTLGSSVSWLLDGRGFFYTNLQAVTGDSGDAARTTSPAVYYHAVGADHDVVRYRATGSARALISHEVLANGRYLVVSESEPGASRTRVTLVPTGDPAAPPIPLLEPVSDFTYLGSEGDRVWFYTRYEAPNGRVVSFDIHHPAPAAWREIIPEDRNALAGSSTVGGNAIGMYGGYLVLLYVEDGDPVLRVYDRDGRLRSRVPFPTGTSLWGGLTGNPRTAEVFFGTLGLYDPGTIHRLQLPAGRPVAFLQPALPVDSTRFVVRREFATSRDGTRVPVLLVHRRDARPDRSHRGLIYGYGLANWISFVWFQPHMVDWVEQGGVYAVAGVRGGGEYGETWHQAGIGPNRQNAVDDYLAASEWLVREGWTTPEQLVANGGSASAALAARAVQLRPDLYGAAVIDRPIIDLLRFESFSTGPYWATEFGSVARPDEFRTLLRQSPYHNIRAGACFPPTLVMTGDRDAVAPSLHAYKFVAALQHAQGCDRPILLKTMVGAGHDFGVTPDQQVDSFRDWLLFLDQVLPRKSPVLSTP